ncbi:MAG: efflux RND transporter permease subunit, partial [Planctomycetota bacterium]
LVDWVMDRTTLISRLGIAITIILALVSLTLKPDERRTEGMPSRAEPVIALGKVDKAMGGLEFGYVNVNWDKSIQSDSPDVLRVVSEVDELLQTEELIGHPLSIRNLIESLPGGGEGGNRMAMLDLLPPPLKRAFYAPEYRTASVSFRVQDIGIAKYGPVFERLQEGLAKISERNSGFNVELEESGAVWRFTNLYVIVVDFLRSLTSAAFIIFIVLSFAYRSLRVGLISIIPNLFPLVLSGAFLVVTGQYLEMVTVCTFIVCLGIAVDDTIHFLTRYQEERRKTDDEQEAIRKAFTGVGTALIMTTVVLLAGFATVLFSENRENRIFGWMGSITIAAALFGDLTFLPALLSRYDGKSKSEPKPAEAEVAK